MDEPKQHPVTQNQHDSPKEEEERQKDQNKQAEIPNNSAMVSIHENQHKEKRNNQGSGGTKRSYVSESSNSDK